MSSNQEGGQVHLLVFGALRTYMEKQGLPYDFHKEIPAEGLRAYDIALGLSIPPERIEAVFFNGEVRNIYDRAFPGDRVAFFPFGTPGPYRVFLGMVRENLERTRREEEERTGAHQEGKPE